MSRQHARRAARENLPVQRVKRFFHTLVAKLAKSFGGRPKVLATSATLGMNSSADRLLDRARREPWRI